MPGGSDETPTGAFPAPPVPKAALVTGGGRRIGRACCRMLADAGYAVAVHYHRSNAEAEATAAAIRGAGGNATTFAGDLTDEGEVAALLPRAAAAFGPIGVLVNNASIFEGDTIDTATRESWDAHMAVNLRAPFVLTQQFARHLPGDAGGCIINLLDERVWSLTPYFVSYTLTKAGLWTLTQTMALALAPRIRVNGIGPGPTLPSPRQSHEQFLQQSRSMPLRRGTAPDEIAAALRFILDAPAMTGQMIALDGGQHLGWAQPRQNAVVE
ncbi:MAG TPA: SDR family oxidoreductase [Stellaceae bacterium]|nr:SDR family oxidoreductase [Stellaceae bacterium]